MTCIIAIKGDNGTIYMGADSAGTNPSNFSQRTRNDSKLCTVGPFMFGFTSSYRMGQLLAHSFVPPDRDPRVSVEKFMCTTFVDAVRKCLKDGGFARTESGEDSGGTFIVSYEGRIFTVEGDFQVAESAYSYEAVGCGADIAMGSLHSTGEYLDIKPYPRITAASSAAEEFSAGVRGPFVFMEQKV